MELLLFESVKMLERVLARLDAATAKLQAACLRSAPGLRSCPGWLCR
ncbi:MULTISPECIES: hypothetical protein [Streptomyces]|uniref:Uncharacterized protein n=1 Tax=Streptomyces ramulosus TaxID=47762 RepID=A0ABW1FV69_9ACTN